MENLKRLQQLVNLNELIHLAMDAEQAVDVTKQRRWWVSPINQRRQQQGVSDNLVKEMRLNDDESFFNFTRLPMSSFDALLQLVSPILEKNPTRKDILLPHKQLLLTLRYLATGDSFASLHYAFRISRSTVAKSIYNTCKAIRKVLEAKHLPALTKDRLMEISKKFQKKTSYPHIIGAIDGKHMNLRAPYRSGSTFYNYKGQFSVVLLAVCDADKKFTYINIGGYGSESDGGIFRNCTLGKMLEEKKINLPDPEPVGNSPPIPYVLLGDAAFPLRPFLMTPFSGRNLDADKSYHNKELSRGRCCIENAFGILAGRWRIFLKTMEIQPKNADDVIMAAILLHNYAMTSNFQTYTNITATEMAAGNETFQPIQARIGSRNASAEANNIREQIKNILLTLK